VRAAIAAAGAELLYLPPYSPDLNPIELAFAMLKALLRTAAARSVDVLWHTIGQLLDAFTPTECAHSLAHAGYVPPNRERLYLQSSRIAGADKAASVGVAWPPTVARSPTAA
jgi:DDE superfamily endonuclease